MDVDLNASLRFEFKKGLDLSGLNDWGSLAYATKETSAISPEDRVTF